MSDHESSAATNSLGKQLAQRKSALGMTVSQLSRRSRVSSATVNRILAGNEQASIANFYAVASALGVTMHLQALRNDDSARTRQAIAKAKQAVALTQASASLENRGVPRTVAKQFQKKLTRQLLKTPRVLWE